MFDVYEVPNYPCPYPRRFLNHFDSAADLLQGMSWGVDELKMALAGSLVENKFVVDWCPKWLQRLGEAVLLEDDPTVEDNIPRIAKALAKKESTTYKTYERAIEKLKKSGTLRDFLVATRELRRIRNRECETGVYVHGHNVSQCFLTINFGH